MLPSLGRLLRGEVILKSSPLLRTGTTGFMLQVVALLSSVILTQPGRAPFSSNLGLEDMAYT